MQVPQAFIEVRTVEEAVGQCYTNKRYRSFSTEVLIAGDKVVFGSCESRAVNVDRIIFHSVTFCWSKDVQGDGNGSDLL